MEREKGASVVSVSDFWSKVAAITFSLWSMIIIIGITAVTNSLSKMSEQQAAFVLTSERRFTLLEDRQANLARSVQENSAAIDALILTSAELGVKVSARRGNK